MRKIAVVTGTRAEYGLLKPLISKLDKDPTVTLQLLVTGMHLMPEYGSTFHQIERDGFNITAKIHDGLKGDSAVEIAESVGTALTGFAEVFAELRPDWIVILGDRSEMLAVASAAIFSSIPIAHIHGGESTEGAYDEFIRHAITKMSHLHFTSTEAYRRRVIQLGEDPSRVFNVGAIGIDSIKSLKLLDKKSFEEAINKKLDKKAMLITFHPVTMESELAKDQFESLLSVLDGYEDTTLIFTKPNSDKGGRIISSMIDKYVIVNSSKAIAFDSLGQKRYLSALQYVDMVIGNSSSGILEVPYFNIPTINIGDRQKGRILPDSVINCDPNHKSISEGITKAMSREFRKTVQKQKQIYGKGNAGDRILQKLRTFEVNTTKKRFYDLNSTFFDTL